MKDWRTLAAEKGLRFSAFNGIVQIFDENSDILIASYAVNLPAKTLLDKIALGYYADEVGFRKREGASELLF